MARKKETAAEKKKAARPASAPQRANLPERRVVAGSFRQWGLRHRWQASLGKETDVFLSPAENCHQVDFRVEFGVEVLAAEGLLGGEGFLPKVEGRSVRVRVKPPRGTSLPPISLKVRLATNPESVSVEPA